MGLRHVAPRAPLGLGRGESVVCIPVFGAHDLFVRCMHSVMVHTPSHIAVVVADDASPDLATKTFLERLDARGELQHTVFYVRQPSNVGFVRNCNDVFEAAHPADVLLLNSDCEVGSGWLERIRAAAYSDTNVATASAITNHGTLISIPYRNRPLEWLPEGVTVAAVNDALRRRCAIWPRIPIAVGHCVFIKRPALELAGPFDEAFSPGYGEEVDFSLRCTLVGLGHVVADDVFVYHRGGSSFGKATNQDEHEALLRSRYPGYRPAVRAAAGDVAGPLARALAAGRAAMCDLSVAIDARCPDDARLSSRAGLRELVAAVAETRRVRLRVILSARTPRTDVDRFRQLPDVRVEVRNDDSLRDEPDDVVHYLFPRYDEATSGVSTLNHRFVITAPDLSMYRNPARFPWKEAWHAFRSRTREIIAFADAVVFASEHAAREAVAEGLVEPSRQSVVHPGLDHFARDQDELGARPRQRLAPAQYLLTLGSGLHSENRLFVLDVLRALIHRYNWTGALVLAGHTEAYGSKAEEDSFLTQNADVAEHVVRIDEYSEDERRWLVRHAAGVIDASIHEEFRTLPFEAAAANTACFFHADAVLADSLPAGAATIERWDADTTARNIAHALSHHARRRQIITTRNIAHALSQHARRRQIITTLGGVARHYTWAQTATSLVDLYERIPSSRTRDAKALAADHEAGLRAPFAESISLPPDVANALYAIVRRPVARNVFYWSVRGSVRIGRGVGRGAWWKSRNSQAS